MRVFPACLLLFCLLATHVKAGTITGQIQTATGGTITNGTLNFTLSQPAILAGNAMISSQAVACYTSNAGNIVGVCLRESGARNC